MALDGLFTHWLTAELAENIVGGRISKVHQPTPYEVQLTIRSKRQNFYLLFCTHPMMARIHFIEQKIASPEFAPTFCMMLRKHLEGAVIFSCHQEQTDRIVHLDVATRDELGDETSYRLTIEMMGRHSNLFLIHRTSGKIIDCLKRVPIAQNSYRTLQPGAIYSLPPQPQKKDPFSLSLFELDSLISFTSENCDAVTRLMELFQGVGLETANEITERSRKYACSLAEAFYHYLQTASKQLQPTITWRENKSFFTPIPYISLNATDQKQYNTLSELLEQYYKQKAQLDRIQQLAGNLLQKLKNDLKKKREKLVKLDSDLSRSEHAETYRIQGELLHIYQHQITKGQTAITVENFYDQNRPLTIELSTRLTPSQNAQQYFKTYQKLRNSIQHIEQQKNSTLAEINYLENVILQIEDSDARNLEMIRFELAENGYIKKYQQKGKQKLAGVKPLEFYSSDGTRILVGRNNIQNDLLTLRQAKKEYLWLHAQNIPGAHVIVESAFPSDQTIGEAATLAAYYSKYRYSATVPVDYVPVSKIRKPNGSKPGFVIYEGQQNTYITPKEEIVEQLRRNKARLQVE